MREPRPLKFVICGLSITSSWGNGHATTYRALVRELALQGHDVLFLEYDKPWYADNRDMPKPPYGRLGLYCTLEEFKDRFTQEIRDADAVIVGSYVPDGVEVGKWVIAQTRGVPIFYDIDTPVTLARLEQGYEDYLSRALVPKYKLYLSFTGGPILKRIERVYGSPKARALYCSVDVREYFPEQRTQHWDLGYLGTFSQDRQSKVEELVLKPSRARPEMKFIVAGAQYPPDVKWGVNTLHLAHLPPQEHRAFYNSQRFTLNVTREDMVAAGYSPSVRLLKPRHAGLRSFLIPGRGSSSSLKSERKSWWRKHPNRFSNIWSSSRAKNVTSSDGAPESGFCKSIPRRTGRRSWNDSSRKRSMK